METNKKYPLLAGTQTKPTANKEKVKSLTHCNSGAGCCGQLLVNTIFWDTTIDSLLQYDLTPYLVSYSRSHNFFSKNQFLKCSVDLLFHLMLFCEFVAQFFRVLGFY